MTKIRRLDSTLLLDGFLLGSFLFVTWTASAAGPIAPFASGIELARFRFDPRANHLELAFAYLDPDDSELLGKPSQKPIITLSGTPEKNGSGTLRSDDYPDLKATFSCDSGCKTVQAELIKAKGSLQSKALIHQTTHENLRIETAINPVSSPSLSEHALTRQVVRDLRKPESSPSEIKWIKIQGNPNRFFELHLSTTDQAGQSQDVFFTGKVGATTPVLITRFNKSSFSELASSEFYLANVSTQPEDRNSLRMSFMPPKYSSILELSATKQAPESNPRP